MWPMFQISLKFTKPNLVNQTFDSSSTRSVVGIHSSHSMLPLQASRTHRMNSILLSMPKSPITGFIKNAMDFIYNSHNFYSFLVTCREESRGGGGGRERAAAVREYVVVATVIVAANHVNCLCG